MGPGCPILSASSTTASSSSRPSCRSSTAAATPSSSASSSRCGRSSTRSTPPTTRPPTPTSRRWRSRSGCAEVGAEPIMQLVCRDRNRLALEADLMGAAMYGIENVSCLTGDDVSAGDEPEARRVFDLDSIQLVALARTLDRGHYLSGRDDPCGQAAFLRRRGGEPVGAAAGVPRAPRRQEGAGRRALPPAAALLPHRAARAVHARRPRHRTDAADRAHPLDLHPAQRRRDALRRRPRAGHRRPARDGPRASSRRPTPSTSASTSPTSWPPTRWPSPAWPACTSSPSARTRASPSSAAASESPHESKESPMDTVLRSRSASVTIGAEQPFCVIGERINPTGRKVFAEQLRNGDLSTVTADALAQAEAGANMLDVNAGIPLVDEPELLKAMLKHRPGRRRPADLHRLLGDRGPRGGPLGLRGPRPGQLRDRRGRAPGRDPAAGGQARRRRHRPGQRRDRHPRDARRSAWSARARSSPRPTTTGSPPRT